MNYEDVAYTYKNYHINEKKYTNYKSEAFNESLIQLKRMDETTFNNIKDMPVVLHHVCQGDWGFKAITIIKNTRVNFGYYVLYYHERNDHHSSNHLFQYDYEYIDFERVWEKIIHVCECNKT